MLGSCTKPCEVNLVQGEFLLDVLPTARNDSYRYQPELNPVSLGSIPSQLLSNYCEWIDRRQNGCHDIQNWLVCEHMDILEMCCTSNTTGCHWLAARLLSLRNIIRCETYLSYIIEGFKWVGTPFLGPPFLQSGIPRPQRALFPWECRKYSFIDGNARSWPAMN